ncbi:MAG: energy transducer TonB [Gammaproteobacteria bacterium]
MKIRNVIGMGAYLLAAPALTAAVSANANTAAPTASSASAQTSYVPTPIWAIAPMYPPIAMYAGAQGDVVVCFTIKPDGTVADAHVKSVSVYSGNSRMNGHISQQFAQSALAAIKQAKFTPQLVNGKPVATPSTCQTVNFRLH